MAVVLAGPKAAPPPPVGVQWTGVTSMKWWVEGVGEVDLLDPSASGVMLLREGVRGLNMPPVERYTSVSPAVAGSRHRGWQTKERTAFWPLLVWTRDGSEAWQAADAALWDTLRPDLVGEWQITTDAAGTRRLRCRWASDGDHAYDRDPLRHGWAVYGVELVAEEPYWMGETTENTWGGQSGAGRTFLPGPPYWIGSSATVDTAVLENPGDVETHIVWTITGPTNTAQVGFRHVDGWGREQTASISIPFPVAEGEELTVDTRPHMQTATLLTPAGDVVDRTGDLGADAAFAPIPPKDEATLTLSLDGPGSITSALTPLYWRAFS